MTNSTENKQTLKQVTREHEQGLRRS